MSMLFHPTHPSSVENVNVTWWSVVSPISWWRHQMETFSASLDIFAGNSPVPGEFPAQRPVTRSFDVFFGLRLNNRLSKQSWGWWFESSGQKYLAEAWIDAKWTGRAYCLSIYKIFRIWTMPTPKKLHTKLHIKPYRNCLGRDNTKRFFSQKYHKTAACTCNIYWCSFRAWRLAIVYIWSIFSWELWL